VLTSSLANAPQSLTKVGKARGNAETLEFVLMCFLHTADVWLQGVIPDTALVTLPSNVGRIAAAASVACENASNFNSRFVACLANLPHGGAVLLDFGGIRDAFTSESWLGQNKICVRVQVALRAYFGFLAGMIPHGAEWTDAAVAWLTGACEEPRVVPGITSATLLLFFESLDPALR
jgi:hypothetical protein